MRNINLVISVFLITFSLICYSIERKFHACYGNRSMSFDTSINQWGSFLTQFLPSKHPWTWKINQPWYTGDKEPSCPQKEHIHPNSACSALVLKGRKWKQGHGRPRTQGRVFARSWPSGSASTRICPWFREGMA